jgi:Zn-dependent peptidase ImmA (M78 family)
MSGLDLHEAAAKADLDENALIHWEQGDDRPTLGEVRKLAEVYKRPLAVFFLDKPPKDFDAQREFRRLPDVNVFDESVEMRLALRRALYRREAAREIYDSFHEVPPSVTDTANPDEDPEIVGGRIRALLGITWNDQLAWESASIALNAWRNSVEKIGVLVFQTSRVSLKEMRATSMPRGPLPVILLNNADSPYGRIFSIFHEFAHILLASGGHLTSPMDGERLPIDRLLERVSNAFAAAALMPRNEFLSITSKLPGVMSGDEPSLLRFADIIKVSPEAILRRLVSLRKVSSKMYDEKRRKWQKRPWFPARKTKGGPPVEVRIVANAGKPFVSLVLEGYRRSKVSSTDVSDYLGVQLKYLDRVKRQVAGNPPSAV